jgi:hypothetical protein
LIEAVASNAAVLSTLNVTSQALREQKTSPREFMPDKENGSMQQL